MSLARKHFDERRRFSSAPLHCKPKSSASRTYAQKIAATLAEKAAKGDIRAAAELADRAEGRARQSIELEQTRLREAFDRMSREELEAYAVSGTLPKWFPKDETVQ